MAHQVDGPTLLVGARELVVEIVDIPAHEDDRVGLGVVLRDGVANTLLDAVGVLLAAEPGDGHGVAPALAEVG